MSKLLVNHKYCPECGGRIKGYYYYCGRCGNQDVVNGFVAQRFERMSSPM